MAVDYDLVVLGDSEAGCWAAIAAARHKARVALITTPCLRTQPSVLALALRELGVKVRQAHRLEPFQLQRPLLTRDDAVNYPLDFDWVCAWADAIVSSLNERDQDRLMSELGIDLIEGPGEFQLQPTLQLQVERRQVRSRAFLIAFEPDLNPPSIPGLKLLTISDLFASVQTEGRQWPQDIVVVGTGPTAALVSQSLAQLGSQVTLVVRDHRILPDEDADAAFLIQARLEAKGVRVLTHCSVKDAIALTNQRQQVITTTTQLEAQAVLWTEDQGKRSLPWNLSELGLASTPQGLWVNSKLQTSHPHIYACGALLGGYPFAHVARYEAEVALKNALFGPFRSVDYRWIPWAVWTDPELARVGLTEAQARQRYAKVHVLKQVYSALDRAHLQGETTGLCKLIVQHNGQILGAHLVGAAAAETIPLIAFAMKHRHPVQDLSDLSPIAPTYAQIVAHAAAAWRMQHQGTLNCLRRWLNLRRIWHI